MIATGGPAVHLFSAQYNATQLVVICFSFAFDAVIQIA